MYYYKVLLVGASGGGKTYSFRNMNRERTVFINIENKPLPFAGDFKIHKVPKSILEVIQFINKSSNTENIDSVVIDSFSAYVDKLLSDARKVKKGYDVWNYYNEHIGLLHEAIKECNKTIFVTSHFEVVTDELGGQKGRKVKVKGNEWAGFIEKDYTIVLYAESRPVLGKRPEYFFTLYNDGTNSAKIPPTIFGEDILTIENDSNLVLQKIKEFSK